MKKTKNFAGSRAAQRASEALEDLGMFQLDLFAGRASGHLVEASEHLVQVVAGLNTNDPVLTSANLRYAGEFMVKAANEIAPAPPRSLDEVEFLSPRERNLHRLSRIFSAAHESMGVALEAIDATGGLETGAMNQMVVAMRRFAQRLEDVAQAVHLGRGEALGNNILLAAGDLEQAAAALGVKPTERKPTEEELQAYVMDALSRVNGRKKTA